MAVNNLAEYARVHYTKALGAFHLAVVSRLLISVKIHHPPFSPVFPHNPPFDKFKYLRENNVTEKVTK
jgi:hypothetical protein